MASGSPSSSIMFFGTIGTTDNLELMAKSQHDSQLLMSESAVPAQHNRQFDDPNQSEVSYPNADVAIAVSPTTLLDANRYVCEVCYRGFPRKQNLALHQRAHNLPFTLKTRTSKDPSPRKVYLCPEPTCVHHNRSHALGDFGGLRKHYLRKHCTEKSYKCDTCCKAYNVEADLRAHLKVCGRKKYVCHCGSCFSRSYEFTLHQANCDASKHVGTAKYPQTHNIEDSSVKSTRNDNNSSSSSRIGSIMLHPTRLGMGDSSIKFDSNENNYNLIGSQISSIQNQSNSYNSLAPYQYQLSQFGEDHSSLMTNPSLGLNFSKGPTFFSQSLTHQNQHECQMKTDLGLYADLLTDKIPLHSLNLEDKSVIEDDSTSYRTGEGSSSFSDGRFMFDPSTALNLTPTTHNTSQNRMLSFAKGISDCGSYGHGSCYGNGYGYGSGQLDYGVAMEVSEFQTSAATACTSSSSSEPHLNQHGFWF